MADFPSSLPAGLRFVQEADDYVLRHFRLYPLTALDLTLVVGQLEYAVSDSVLRIWSATYYTSATASQTLRATSIDELDSEYPLWRDSSSGVPTRYYDVGTVVGILPAPSTATAAGYPKVTLQTTQRRVLVSGTTMPGNVPNYNLWVHHACEAWARRQHREEAGFYAALKAQSFDEMADFVAGRQVRNKPRFRFPVPSVRNV